MDRKVLIFFHQYKIFYNPLYTQSLNKNDLTKAHFYLISIPGAATAGSTGTGLTITFVFHLPVL